ncbi:MAG TPA: hypothetical protein VEC37_15675 [Bacillota bacterium]|nr:hypothetical protein [Bacillota bacterium]
MIDIVKNAFWGWWVNLGLTICLVISLAYGFWQGTLNQVEESRLQSDSKQLQTRIAFLETQIRQAKQVANFGDANTVNNLVLHNRQQLYDFFTNAAESSGLVIQKLILRPVEVSQGAIAAEMEFAGNYPETQAFIQQLYAGNLNFVLDKMTMVQNPDPKRSLNLTLMMNIAIPKGGS